VRVSLANNRGTRQNCYAMRTLPNLLDCRRCLKTLMQVFLMGFFFLQVNMSQFFLSPLKPKHVWIIFKNSVRTSKKTQLFTITKINWLMLFKETIAVYFDNHMKSINTKCRVIDCQSRWYIELNKPTRCIYDCNFWLVYQAVWHYLLVKRTSWLWYFQ
jgi:hypothetical protein